MAMLAAFNAIPKAKIGFLCFASNITIFTPSAMTALMVFAVAAKAPLYLA
jgi:hypothetical protein